MPRHLNLPPCLQSILQLLQNLRPDSNNLLVATMRHIAFRLGVRNFKRTLDLCWFFQDSLKLGELQYQPANNKLDALSTSYVGLVSCDLKIYINGYGTLAGNSPGSVVWEFLLNEVQWDDDTLPKHSRMFLGNTDQQRVPYLFTVSLTNKGTMPTLDIPTIITIRFVLLVVVSWGFHSSISTQFNDSSWTKYCTNKPL